jgi:hypothetical protein
MYNNGNSIWLAKEEEGQLVIGRDFHVVRAEAGDRRGSHYDGVILGHHCLGTTRQYQSFHHIMD